MLGEIDLWRRLSEAIAAERQHRADGIVSGNIDTLERYRFECGILKGLEWVVGEAERIVREARAAAGDMDVVTEGDE